MPSKSVPSGRCDHHDRALRGLAEQLPVRRGGGEAELLLEHRRRLHQRRGRGQVGVVALVEEAAQRRRPRSRPTVGRPARGVRRPSRSRRAARRPAGAIETARSQVGPVRAGATTADPPATSGHRRPPRRPPIATRLRTRAPVRGRGGVRLAAWPPRDVLAAGAVVLPQRDAGAARAPAAVRRLVVPQGQARPGRARDRRRGPRGGRGDRAARAARAAAGRASATPTAAAG